MQKRIGLERAWWVSGLLIAGACGSVSSVDPDASSSDDSGAPTSDGDPAAEDGAPSPDAPPASGEAAVELRLGGAISPGIDVVFHAPDGSIADEKVTDSTGSAAAVVERDGMITLAAGPEDLVTLARVQPGDEISYATPRPFDDSLDGDVFVSASEEAPNKNFYRLDLGNDHYITTSEIVNQNQLNLKLGVMNEAGDFDTVVATYDESNEIISYTYVEDVAGNVGGDTNVTVPTPFKTDIEALTIDVSGAPTGGGNLIVDSANRLDGLRFVPTYESQDAAGGAASITVPYLGGFGTVETRIELGLADGRFEWRRRAERPAPDISLGSGDMPPRLSPALDVSNPPRPVMSWGVDGDASGGDVVIVRLFWEAESGDTFTWTAFVPPEADTFTFPVLPGALADQGPQATSTIRSARVTYTDLDNVADYQAFRREPVIDFQDVRRMPDATTSMTQSRNAASLP